MTDHPTDDASPADTVAEVRAQLLETFGDYHARIAAQVALVDRLIAAVERDARSRAVRPSS